MFFIIREIVGWVFVAFSLYLMRSALSYVENRQVIEAGIVVFICGLLLRAGVHLIRVATAARICMKSPAAEET